ncbi:NCS1 family nucleobase:cation symporter-1 [Amycolatopsis jiangsuensis]|uniref:NCS1 family nucleobase:cation symporter-1 n=1 Tax=Amycolatopsis jiangsuensis TaxID=1181879 RepID=A0A840IQX1_9PSEU|nr:NCS1 family nucleobase:cation symporter-1 [Amycolatopsis jiangsuensis]MBB4683845.1 NCS1 family nucleobase:cation symporter-1 [Amycolatopsis jiangsuensis]
MSESGPSTTVQRSPRLYNEDLAPRRPNAVWRTWDLFCVWMSAVHSLGGYTFAVGLLVLGLNGWQMALAMVGGVAIVYLGCNLMGVAGQRLGVPFPVFARVSFGVFGANVPALLRAVVAIFWYAIQTYLASAALMILVLKLVPPAAAWTHASFLGLSGLGWLCFLGLWLLQLVVLHRGMETVRKLSDLSGPVIWIAMLALAIWVLARAGWHLDWTYHEGGPGMTTGSVIVAVVSGVFLTVSYFAGPMLNYADFARFAPDKRTVLRGNRLGLPLNASAFCVVSVIIALGTVRLYGKAISDPVQLVAELDSTAALLLGTVAFALATVGVNIVLNFVSPAYDLANTFPKRISFKTGGLITAVLALVVLPWKIYANPVAVNYFLGGVGALMGPLFGILLADYYLIRRARVDVAQLYTDAVSGAYHYRRGTNLRAVAALVTSGAVTLVVALVPALADFASYAWPIGVVLGVVCCLAFTRGGTALPPQSPARGPAQSAATSTVTDH